MREFKALLEQILKTVTLDNIDSVVDEYADDLKSCVDIDAYRDFVMKHIDYPEGGDIQEKVDYFVMLKEQKKALSAIIEEIDERLSKVQDELIAWMDSNPVNQLTSTANKVVSKVVRVYPKVTDLYRLKESLGELWYQVEGVNTKALGEIVRGLRDKAEAEGKDVTEFLPDGIELSYIQYLSVRQGKVKRASFTDDGLDTIINIIKGGKNNGSSEEGF